LRQLYNNNRVWGEPRQRGVAQAARRLQASALAEALRDAARIDRIIKGLSRGDAWDELLQLCLRFAA
jgi:DNA polymerase-3 subunit delta